MNKHAQRAVALALALGPLACFGDSSYRETTQTTGGQLVDSMKNVPSMSKQWKSLTDPATTTTMVRGNQKAVVTNAATEIYDLDKQEIVHIDAARKEYSMDSFAYIRKLLAKTPDRMKQAQAPAGNLQYSFSASVSDTGVRQVVNGLNAKQQVLKLTMIVTDPSNPATKVTYTTTSEIWTTADVPEAIKDAQDFDARFAQALMPGADLSAALNLQGGATNAEMAQMFAGKAGAAEASAQMGKELAKIKGTPILVKTSMAQPAGGSAANSLVETGTGGNVMMKAVGSLSGLWNKKKSQPASTAPAASPTNTPQTPAETVLLETTTQKSNFSHDPVPASAFQIPAGFKQVPSPLAQANP